MEDFIYELAKRKYTIYQKLFKFIPNANTERECIDRLKVLSRYDELLSIINMLPNNEAIRLADIEKEYFSDAPYVFKLD